MEDDHGEILKFINGMSKEKLLKLLNILDDDLKDMKVIIKMKINLM